MLGFGRVGSGSARLTGALGSGDNGNIVSCCESFCERFCDSSSEFCEQLTSSSLAYEQGVEMNGYLLKSEVVVSQNELTNCASRNRSNAPCSNNETFLTHIAKAKERLLDSIISGLSSIASYSFSVPPSTATTNHVRPLVSRRAFERALRIHRCPAECTEESPFASASRTCRSRPT